MHNSRSVNSMFLTIKMILSVKNIKFADFELRLNCAFKSHCTSGLVDC